MVVATLALLASAVGLHRRQHDHEHARAGQDVAHHREVDRFDRVLHREGEDQAEGEQKDAESVSHEVLVARRSCTGPTPGSHCASTVLSGHTTVTGCRTTASKK